MSLLFLLLMPSACILLQALSKNLIYVFVAAGCILAAMSVILSETKVRWWSLILALGANSLIALYSFQMHIWLPQTTSPFSSWDLTQIP